MSEFDFFKNMSIYGDTYGMTQEEIDADKENSDSTDSDSTGIGEIILPPISSIGSGEGGEENINRNRNIDYNNLIVRNQSTGTGIDSDPNIIRIANFDEMFGDKKFTNEIGNFKGDTNLTVKSPERFNFPEDKKTGILEGLKTKGNALLEFIKKGGVIGNIVSALLPEQDPRGIAMRNFYGDNFGLNSDGSVASGIMQNYNPISGGFLNWLTKGKHGDETQYGLGPAIDKRRGNIRNTLKDKYGINTTMSDEDLETFMKSIEGQKLFGIKPGHTSAVETYFNLEKIKQAQAQAAKTAAAEAAKTAAAAVEKQKAADTAAGAFKSTVQQDKDGGGSWKEQTAAKERQKQSVAGPGFGKGAYFKNGGIVTL